MTLSLTQRYALWLLPASLEREALQTQRQALRKRFGAVVFPAHLTLLAERDTPLRTIQATVARLFANLAPLTLASTGVNVAPTFCQTLFVEFAAHPGLSALVEQWRQALASSFSRSFHPHLS